MGRVGEVFWSLTDPFPLLELYPLFSSPHPPRHPIFFFYISFCFRIPPSGGSFKPSLSDRFRLFFFLSFIDCLVLFYYWPFKEICPVEVLLSPVFRLFPRCRSPFFFFSRGAMRPLLNDIFFASSFLPRRDRFFFLRRLAFSPSPFFFFFFKTEDCLLFGREVFSPPPARENFFVLLKTPVSRSLSP